jgi:hypothetical protein
MVEVMDWETWLSLSLCCSEPLIQRLLVVVDEMEAEQPQDTFEVENGCTNTDAGM